MDAVFRFLGVLARRFPAVAALAKPLLLPPIHHLLRLRAAAQTDLTGLAHVPLRVPTPWRRDEEANVLLTTIIGGDSNLGIGAKADGRDVLMLVVSDLRIDPRVRREAMALAEAGYRVTVVCPSPFADTQMPPVIDWGKGVDIFYVSVACGNYVGVRPGFEGGALFDVIAREFADRSFLAVHAHDLNTAYVALGFARLKGANLVVDFHEWTSENVHWDDIVKSWLPYPQDWKEQLQALEQRVMREASAVITVSPSIASAISHELGEGRELCVIRNIPEVALSESVAYRSMRDVLGVRPDQFLILYQGGIGPTRRIEPVISALAHAPECVLVIRGPRMDLYEDGYRRAAEDDGVTSRVHLLDAVPSTDVVAATHGADAGLYTVSGICRNYKLALPNKVYEYVAGGLPVLVPHYPEVSHFVHEAEIGLAFDPEDPLSIADAMNRLASDAVLTARFRANSKKALFSVAGEREWQKLVALYDALPRTGEKAGPG
jgi:glycosyltransferase involved in cell wall biosynthesis